MATPQGSVQCPIRTELDLPGVRVLLRKETEAVGLSLVEATKFITAGSELARNIVRYAPRANGVVGTERLQRDRRRGLRAVFHDRGPGIDQVGLALQDGYSSGGSLGLGLPGARRLVDEFLLESSPGVGTTVTIVMWVGALGGRGVSGA